MPCQRNKSVRMKTAQVIFCIVASLLIPVLGYWASSLSGFDVLKSFFGMCLQFIVLWIILAGAWHIKEKLTLQYLFRRAGVWKGIAGIIIILEVAYILIVQVNVMFTNMMLFFLFLWIFTDLYDSSRLRLRVWMLKN